MSRDLDEIFELSRKIRGMAKEAYTPVAPGMSPAETQAVVAEMAGQGQIPPEMAGQGQIPPEMAGAMPPEMAGGMPPGAVPPEMAGGMPPPGGEDPMMMIYDMVVQAVRQGIQEAGAPAQGAPEPEKEKKKSPQERMNALEQKVDALMGALGVPFEEQGANPEGDAQEQAAPEQQPQGAGFGPGSGEAAAPMAFGPMDPAGQQVMADMGPMKTASLASDGIKLAAALKK